MIRQVTFKNFKALRDLTVDLERFTVLVGPNSCGKTSVLQGIHYLSQVGLRRRGETKDPSARLTQLFSGPRHPQRLATIPGTGPIHLGLNDDGGRSLAIDISFSRVEEEEESQPEFTIH